VYSQHGNVIQCRCCSDEPADHGFHNIGAGRPETWIEYLREAGSNEIDVSTVIRIGAGTDVKTLQWMTRTPGDDSYQTFADRQFVQKALRPAALS
jgi:hypothetical protein